MATDSYDVSPGSTVRAGDRSRTRDIFFTREALYQLSYTGKGASA
jgi:hypothetical protein